MVNELLGSWWEPARHRGQGEREVGEGGGTKKTKKKKKKKKTSRPTGGVSP